MAKKFPKFLLLGKYGQLGRELSRTLLPVGELAVFDLPDIDFTKPMQLQAMITELKPQVIINAVAYTNVDLAETQQDLCRLINHESVAAIGAAAQAIHAGVIHVSTDYVFDGTASTPYQETDATHPLSYYGKTKLDAEISLQESGAAYWIFRTAWLYSLTREDFVRKVLNWSRAKKELRIVDDQIGSPTWARMLAELMTMALVRGGTEDIVQFMQATSGIYHLTGSGAVSRLDWVKRILELDPQPQEQIVEVLLPAKTREFVTPAQRPLHSPLDCSKFEKTFGLRVPTWEEMLASALEYAG